MLVEAGKRYVARNGDVSGPLSFNNDSRTYKFVDIKNGRTYAIDGVYAVSEPAHSFTLVSEYIEPCPVIADTQAAAPQEQKRSAWNVPSGTDKHEIRIGSLFIVQKGRTQFEEGCVIVSITDDAAGEYVTIGNPEAKHPVGLDPSEWPVIRETIDFMVAHCRTPEEMK